MTVYGNVWERSRQHNLIDKTAVILWGTADFFVHAKRVREGSFLIYKKSIRIGHRGRDKRRSLRLNYKRILEQQLAIDYDCSIADVQGTENIFRTYKKNDNARLAGEAGSGFKLACVNGKLLVMAEVPLLEWCNEKLANVEGAWISEPANLICLHEKLKEYGQVLADAHHYYIPAENAKKQEHRFDVRWYEKEEIKAFEGDERFDEALLFDEEIPDMLAVCAMKGETILGMAGATADTPMVWQIGVNVTEEGTGLGIGTYVIALLKQRVLEEGKLPLYSTVESHIKSQKVAFAAGFVPAFYEIFSEKES